MNKKFISDSGVIGESCGVVICVGSVSQTVELLLNRIGCHKQTLFTSLSSGGKD